MKKLIVLVALAALICLPGMAMASATPVLYFDDVPGGLNPDYTTFALPTSYHGLTWSAPVGSGSYWGVIDISDYNASWGNSLNFPSYPNAVTNDNVDLLGASSVTISSATPFNFIGAYFGTWTAFNTSNFYGATGLTIAGSLLGNPVGSDTITLNPGPLAWYNVNFTDIDSLTFTPIAGSQGQYFLMDNFNVPLPPSVLLLGSGLLGVGLLGRRKIFKA